MKWYDNDNDDAVAGFLKPLEVYIKMIWIKNLVLALTHLEPIHSCSIQEHWDNFGATFCSKIISAYTCRRNARYLSIKYCVNWHLIPSIICLYQFE